MKQFMMTAGLLFVGIMAWRLGERLSADAVSLGLGVMLGVVAGVPAALLLLASGRRPADSPPAAESRSARPELEHGLAQSYGQLSQGMLPQMPVIVLAGGATGQNGFGQAQPPLYPALPGPGQTIETRQFKVVGEQEEWLDEF